MAVTTSCGLSCLAALLLLTVVSQKHAEARLSMPIRQDPGNPTKVRVACVGDSITAGYLASNASMSYPGRLQQILGDNYVVTNFGEGGATLQRHGDSPYVERPSYSAFLEGTWDMVIIMLGTNDAKDTGDGSQTNNWREECSNRSASASSCPFWRDYLDLIAEARQRGPELGTPPAVLIAKPPPLMMQSAYTMNETVLNDIMPRLVAAISADAGLGPSIDVYGALGGRGDWRDVYPTCGCQVPHPKMTSPGGPMRVAPDALSAHPGAAGNDGLSGLFEGLHGNGFRGPLRGYLPAGNDWRSGEFTLTEAEGLCGSSDECAGLSFSLPASEIEPLVHTPSEAAKVTMYLKRCGQFFTPDPDGQWRTYLKDPPVPLPPQPDTCRFFCDAQSCDECHPNDAGYLRLAQAVAERAVFALAQQAYLAAAKAATS